MKCFMNALERNPDNWDAKASIGMIYQLNGETIQAISKYHEALLDPQAGGSVNELLEIALVDSSKMPISSHLKVNDKFDIFQVAKSIHEIKDEVEIELDEGYWEKKESQQMVDDDMIINTQSDLVLDDDNCELSRNRTIR